MGDKISTYTYVNNFINEEKRYLVLLVKNTDAMRLSSSVGPSVLDSIRFPIDTLQNARLSCHR